ncbi:MAG: hypothetical protein EOL95_09335 [Bacteroidia bacterium]|nr:hypothetical protein [Bacteroidia bacterium]
MQYIQVDDTDYLEGFDLLEFYISKGEGEGIIIDGVVYLSQDDIENFLERNINKEEEQYFHEYN